MRMTRKDIISLLQLKGIKSSTARLKIMQICCSSDLPLDVQEVTSLLKNEIHLSTVYRTLEKFVAVGILERIDFQEGKFRYEFVRDHHHHVVCNDCGKVADIKDSGIEKIEQSVSLQTGFIVTKHSLELFGLCNKCQRSTHHV